MRVNGNTNVNKFSCVIDGYSKPDTLSIHSICKDGTVTMSGSIGLPVASFDCRNSVMTSDLRKTLKAKDYPKLSIHFVSLRQYPAFVSGKEVTCGTVTIELAGVSRKFAINYRVSKDGQEVISLAGSQIIRFSDFGLTPPRKMGGMIKANDQLEVEFFLFFKKIGA